MATPGLAYGKALVLIGALAWQNANPETIITHELLHAELHKSLTLRDISVPRFPMWFDEGLASWIA